ncbi:EcoKI restriction-modification system protein HsdS [Paenibacillus sp. P1XP2]|nr:EcoKI restriction-modification system protein HsdS [Paenibacillus sp. P1XP2]
MDINPFYSIRKGTLAKKISMADLEPFTRKITNYEVAEFNGGSKFKNGDTLVARITPCLENGKTAYVNILEKDEIGFGSTEFIVLRGKEGISDNKYVYYLSISPEFRNVAIKSMTGTSGRQRAQVDAISKWQFRLPPIKEQKEISALLSSLDDKIELNNAINKNLEEMAQALFKRWFVDFEFPNENGEPYKSNGGEFEESELGLIPKGWTVGVFENISSCYDSKRVPLSKKERESRAKIYPYYGAASLMDYVDDYLFEGVYVLMGEDGTVVDEEGFPVLQYVWGKFWVNNHAHVLKGNSAFSEEYIYLLLKRTNVKHIVTGAVQPKINQKNMNSIKVVIPPKDILYKFNKTISGLFGLIRENTDQNRILINIRDTLLPKLMSGEIRVPVEQQ